MLHLPAGTARRASRPARRSRCCCAPLTAVFRVCALRQLMLISVLPSAVRNPLKHIISKLDVPYAGQAIMAVGVALLAGMWRTAASATLRRERERVPNFGVVVDTTPRACLLRRPGCYPPPLRAHVPARTLARSRAVSH